jgi:hypothetical protein
MQERLSLKIQTRFFSTFMRRTRRVRLRLHSVQLTLGINECNRDVTPTIAVTCLLMARSMVYFRAVWEGVTMKKVWVFALVLIAACCFFAGRSAGSADGLPATPQIIRRVELTNQTTPIPPTTLFTPTYDGIYRISVYMTLVSSNEGTWTYHLHWTDDAGDEETQHNPSPLNLPPRRRRQAFGYAPDTTPGNVLIIEAVAGQPVEYHVDRSGGNGGVYSLYFVVERLAGAS